LRELAPEASASANFAIRALVFSTTWELRGTWLPPNSRHAILNDSQYDGLTAQAVRGEP